MCIHWYHNNRRCEYIYIGTSVQPLEFQNLPQQSYQLPSKVWLILLIWSHSFVWLCGGPSAALQKTHGQLPTALVNSSSQLHFFLSQIPSKL